MEMGGPQSGGGGQRLEEGARVPKGPQGNSWAVASDRLGEEEESDRGCAAVPPGSCQLIELFSP